MFIQLKRLGGKNGFTFVELLVVIAIISILAAVALPAYNNYSLKSKFTEVVLATAPTKTAISTCAVSGDCVSGSAISLLSQSGGGSLPAASAPMTTTQTTALSQAQVYALTAATYLEFGATTARAQSLATSQATDGNTYYLYLSPGTTNVCLSNNPPGCIIGNVPIAQANALMNSTNPYYSSTPAAQALSLPCVGAAATGCSPPTKYTASVSYDASGNITATAQSTSGLNAETFVLAPNYSGGRVDWAASGTCKTRAGGALC